MRKYLFIYIALIFILPFIYFCNSTPCFAQTEAYYRISAENVLLYRTPTDSNSIDNVYFTLPTSYFVKFISDENEDFLKVQYLDFIGYVLKSDVTQVYSTPTTPYNTQSFSILATANPVIWSLPTTQSTYLGNIPFNAKEVIYFGSVSGEVAQNTENSIWYFCKFISFEQGILTGYIHSNLTTNLTEFLPNTEIVELEPSITTNGQVIAPELQNSTSLLLILGLCIPALFLLILVFKPEKRKKKTEAKRQISSLNRLDISDKNSRDELDF